MILFCRLKARLFGPKNQYFWNKSGKAQPIRSPDQIRYVYVDTLRGDNVQRILGTIGPF